MPAITMPSTNTTPVTNIFVWMGRHACRCSRETRVSLMTSSCEALASADMLSRLGILLFIVLLVVVFALGGAVAAVLCARVDDTARHRVRFRCGRLQYV